jgi:hypothetical protein
MATGVVKKIFFRPSEKFPKEKVPITSSKSTLSLYLNNRFQLKLNLYSIK